MGTLSLTKEARIYNGEKTASSISGSLVAQRKESACTAGDMGLVPGSGGSPGEGNGNPLQDSCLENPMDGEAW